MWSKPVGKKVIFFDMGNTLISFHKKGNDKEKEKLGELYLLSFLQERFPEVNEVNLREEFLNPWYDLMGQRSKTKEEYPIDELLNQYLGKRNAYLSYPECINALRVYFRPFLENIEKEKNLYDTLKTLKDNGYKLAIISNTPYFKEVNEECLEEAGIDGLFDELIFSYDVRVAKPKYEIFEYALRLMNVRADECVMVGDSLLNDMAPASDLGMKCYWLNIKNDDNYLDVKNVTEIDSLSDLVDELLIQDQEEQEVYVEVEEIYEEDDDFDVNDYLFEEDEDL